MHLSNRQPFPAVIPMMGIMFFIGIGFFTVMFGGSGMTFFWIFPLLGFGAMLVMLFVARYLFFGQHNPRPSQLNTRIRRSGSHCGNMFGETIAAVPSSASIREQNSAHPHSADTIGQSYLTKAQAYRQQIHNLIKSTSNQTVRAQLQKLTLQVDEWVKAVADLGKSIDRRDFVSVPQSIQKMEAQLANATDSVTRQELERTITNYKNQLAALHQLQNITDHAEIKMESTLSALGTVYSQVLTAQSTNQIDDYNRLLSTADEEVRTLQDYLEALEEVKLGKDSL